MSFSHKFLMANNVDKHNVFSKWIQFQHIINLLATDKSGLSISFEVDVLNGKVDGSLLFFLGGSGGMSPSENFEI